MEFKPCMLEVHYILVIIEVLFKSTMVYRFVLVVGASNSLHLMTPLIVFLFVLSVDFVQKIVSKVVTS